MDELIDFVTLEPYSQKRIYQLSEAEQKKHKESLIMIPEILVKSFKTLYAGPRYDGRLPIRALSPGPNMNPKDNLVFVRELVPFKETWGEFPNPYLVYLAGFSYTVQVTNETGFTVPHHIPMIDWENPDLDTFFTNGMPFYQWAQEFDSTWDLIAPICTMVEKIIAKNLFDNNMQAGFGGGGSMPIAVFPGGDDAAGGSMAIEDDGSGTADDDGSNDDYQL